MSFPVHQVYGSLWSLVFNKKKPNISFAFLCSCRGWKEAQLQKQIGEWQRSESKLIVNTVRPSVKCSLSPIQTLITDSGNGARMHRKQCIKCLQWGCMTRILVGNAIMFLKLWTRMDDSIPAAFRVWFRIPVDVSAIIKF